MQLWRLASPESAELMSQLQARQAGEFSYSGEGQPFCSIQAFN